MYMRPLLLLAGALAAPAAPRQVRFAGTVSHAKEFRKEIAPGLSFVLNPTETGWMIAIVPAAAWGPREFRTFPDQTPKAATR